MDAVMHMAHGLPVGPSAPKRAAGLPRDRVRPGMTMPLTDSPDSVAGKLKDAVDRIHAIHKKPPPKLEKVGSAEQTPEPEKLSKKLERAELTKKDPPSPGDKFAEVATEALAMAKTPAPSAAGSADLPVVEEVAAASDSQPKEAEKPAEAETPKEAEKPAEPEAAEPVVAEQAQEAATAAP